MRNNSKARLNVFFVTALIFCLIFNGLCSANSIGEKIDRGLVALPRDRGVVYVGWRLFDSDPNNVAFNLYRMEVGSKEGYKKINDQPIASSTDYVDDTVLAGGAYRYKVASVVNGKERQSDNSAFVFAFPWNKPYISILMQGDYRPMNVAVADLDGDGRYDYVIKQPTFNTDPWREKGYWKRSLQPYKLEAYGSDGKFMWRYDMGWAIETGKWYSPYIVYDLDGDGCAEVYTKAGVGDSREIDGHVVTGAEFLVKLDGRTGKALAKIDWLSREGFTSYNYFNRNFLTIAYLDGRKPSLIMQRGTYNLIKTMALDRNLKPIWCWEQPAESGDWAYRSLGSHGLISADVDSDGKDELVLGAMVVDDNGQTLWALKMGHPDVCYAADIDVDNPGLEIFYGFETAREQNGICLVDGKTGRLLWGHKEPTKHIHSQGMAADVLAEYDGMEVYGGEQKYAKRWLYSSKGRLIEFRTEGSLSPRAVWWDADCQKEVIFSKAIADWGGQDIQPIEGRVLAVVDFLGDWREEVITGLEGQLRIYSTTISATNRRTCLMQDRQYRLGVVAQSMGYHYPPQLGK